MQRFGALLLLVCLANPAQAERSTINPFVRAKIDSMTMAMYGPSSAIVTLRQYGMFRERGDATRSLPDAEIDAADLVIRNITYDQDGVLFGATSPTRVDPLYTKGSSTLNITWNEAFQLGRARYVNDRTGRRCVVATQGIANDTTCVYLAVVQRPPGVPSLVPGRENPNLVTRQELRDSLARVQPRLNNHERRIKALEVRPPGGLSPDDIGLSGFIGGATYTVADQVYNGPVVGFTVRYLDIAFEGFLGENFNDSQRMVWATPYDLIPRFSNNHFEGGSVYWAPPQPAGPSATYHYRNGSTLKEPGRQRFGWYWKLGVTGAHLQRDNIENVSNLEAYYLGGVASLALPLPVVTPELVGTIGYSWTHAATTTHELAPSKDEGVGYGLRAALVIGRR